MLSTEGQVESYGSQGRADNTTGRGRGFTLIEVLVVVAIIALLISILLPSLKRARDQAKVAVCMTHLKQIGTAIEMYRIDHRDILPGPVHFGLLKDVNAPLAAGAWKWPAYAYLPSLLRKYFGESTKGSGGTSDEIATCPAFPVDDDQFVGTAAINYCINTYDNAFAGEAETKPPFYFGFTNASYETAEIWHADLGKDPKYRPKKAKYIKQPAREWMIADAFRRPFGYKGAVEVSFSYNMLPRGSYAFEADWDSYSGQSLPLAPFHLAKRQPYKQVPTPGGGGYVYNYEGKVSTLYFDTHVSSQNGWKGTVQAASAAVAP